MFLFRLCANLNFTGRINASLQYEAQSGINGAEKLKVTVFMKKKNNQIYGEKTRLVTATDFGQGLQKFDSILKHVNANDQVSTLFRKLFNLLIILVILFIIMTS